jgi:hypothetical protein
MEIVALIIVLVGGYFVWKAYSQKTENSSYEGYTGSPELKSLDPAPVHSALDVNKDGKVDVKDAVEVVKKTRTRAKKVATETVKAVKTRTKKAAATTKTPAAAKPRGRRPASKNT